MQGSESDVGSDSSSVLADVHMRVIHGFLLDRQSSGVQAPLIILELGASSARFAYRLIRALATRCRHFPMPSETPFVYVMAGDDRAVAGWKANSWLNGLVVRGLLDFACIDIDSQGDPTEAIVLEQLGSDLEADFQAPSVVVIANQIFSRAPSDRFLVEDGRLHQYVANASSEQAGTHELQALSDRSVYEREDWNQLLADYTDELNRAAFSISPSALGWLERVLHLSPYSMLLCVDRGYINGRNLEGRAPSHLAAVGTATSTVETEGEVETEEEVNFHALSEFTRRNGGAVLAPAESGTASMVVAFFHSESSDTPLETVRGYHAAVDEYSRQDDWRALEPLLAASLADASIEQLGAYLGASSWDDRALAKCIPHLLARVQTGDISAEDRSNIRRMVEEVWSNYVPDRSFDPSNTQPSAPRIEGAADPPDLAFAIGGLLFGLDFHQRAEEFFTRSMQAYGPSAAANYNLALCVAQRGQRERALGYLDAALALEPGFTSARDMRLQVMSGM